MSNVLAEEIEKRRTFAIISHPDAGKTTLTEKLLLYGGAIHLAGAVKAKAAQRHTTSDWMEIERQRGISVSSSALQFFYQGFCINLLDTPGHKDFSEDTYRTLVAADAAVMLIDAAKGVEQQTRKLFEVCRLRGIPIFTFINKMDRPCLEPLDLLAELESVLGIASYAMNWPVGLGDQFQGVFDRKHRALQLFQTEGEANVKGKIEPQILSLDNVAGFVNILNKRHSGSGFKLDEQDVQHLYERLLADLDLLDHAGEAFSLEKLKQGQQTAVFFGSAMNNFGVEDFLHQFLYLAPAPAGRLSLGRALDPKLEPFSGFVFKIQANMDPQHRDRIAFIRICSGQFTRNMVVFHHRTGEQMKLAKSVTLFAQQRVLIESAVAGDIIGLIDTTGSLRLGDTLAANKGVVFEGIPFFSPEFFSTIALLDPMKRKQLKKGIEQLSEEGVIQVYYPTQWGDQNPILGAVGALQFEIFEHRLKTEYGVAIRLERLGYTFARWVEGLNPKTYLQRDDATLVTDMNQDLVLLFKSQWACQWVQQNNPTFKLAITKAHLTAPKVT
jgi:peptide chain release factor 3